MPKKRKKRIPMPFEALGGFSVSPSGAHLVVSAKFEGAMWHLDGDQNLTQLPAVGGRISSVAVNDDGLVAVAYDTEAAIERKSSGVGAPGGSFVEVWDAGGRRVHQHELLNTAYARLSWSPTSDAVLAYDPTPFVGLLDVSDGALTALELPPDVRSVVACFCGDGLLLATPGSLYTHSRRGAPTLVKSGLAYFGDLVSAGRERAVMVGWGGGAWGVFDSKGSVVASGAGMSVASGDGDGVALAAGKKVTRLDASGAERETLDAKGEVTALGSGGGRLFAVTGLYKSVLVELTAD